MSVFVLVFAFAVVCIVAAKWERTRLPLPPGPKPLPIIGNLLNMPSVVPWIKYHEWSHVYKSGIVYAYLPFQPIVILGSYKAAIDLLDKRSQLYSDRIASVMLRLMTWDFGIGFMTYTPRWRIHRKMFHHHFQSGVVDRYRPIQLREIRKFLLSTLQAPQNTRGHVRQMITSVIFSVTYGKCISNVDDQYVVVAEQAVEGLSKASIPGEFWIECLPFLRHLPSWIPGTKSKQFADHFKRYVIEMRDKPYNEVKVAMENGSAPASLSQTLIEEVRVRYGGTDEEAVYDEVAKNVAGIAYGAGADTTSSSCLSFLLAMALFPEVQKKAQAELDQVVGSNRLPDYNDLDNMPYIRAVTMEAMRWMPVLPIGIPHAVIADDTYEGYHIPKGSMVIPNAWAMLHDPVDYPQPEEFKPERYLGDDGQIDPTVLDPSDIAFGFGRRICLGRDFSNNTLSFFIASILHVFDIDAGFNGDGVPMKLSTETNTGLVVVPRDVPCGLKPRSERAARLIHESVGGANG